MKSTCTTSHKVLYFTHLMIAFVATTDLKILKEQNKLHHLSSRIMFMMSSLVKQKYEVIFLWCLVISLKEAWQKYKIVEIVQCFVRECTAECRMGYGENPFGDSLPR